MVLIATVEDSNGPHPFKYFSGMAIATATPPPRRKHSLLFLHGASQEHRRPLHAGDVLIEHPRQAFETSLHKKG